MFHVVLVEPEIPPNTGNVARLCAATGAVLHLVGPLGFELNDATLKRAGMDYWKWVQWHYHDSLESVFKNKLPQAAIYCVETWGEKNYSDIKFQPGDYFIFGRETKGLSKKIVDSMAAEVLRIPIWHENARSLNLSNCVAIVLFEAWRQNNFSAPA
ncbi:MAG: tRNA (uridine(34)/cytosine(34)/5-carboxymethylaminomethyluridine(34)-2'-O)-methyltransferase TrmL [Verrucomicrobiae bacterium]|nr:tRNA (uridine(34)/cytosine(34)/5-carboxymethylaminomethyluridine(34)-2'-O)-methyltransferase TrmL [Verrucomicrobiae bacterium]